MKAGEKINTPDGAGTISFIEEFRMCTRVCVELENNPFNYPIVCYFVEEIKNFNK